MKNTIKIIAILAILLVSALTVHTAYAEEDQPQGSLYSDLMIEAFALEIGKPVAQIQVLRNEGLTYYEIAQEFGYEGEELYDLMARVGETMLELAVDDGLIPQEISDQLFERWERWTSGTIFGMFLDKLGLNREELEDMLESGMTFQEIMVEQGFELSGNLAERCGLTREQIIARLQAGETFREICPGVLSPEGGWPWQNQP